MKENIYYTIEKVREIWVVWKNVEIKKKDRGSYGSYNLFSGTLKDCKKYAGENKLRIKGGKAMLGRIFNV